MRPFARSEASSITAKTYSEKEVMKRVWAAGLETLIARSQNLLKPRSSERPGTDVHQDINILSCNFAKLWFPLGAVLVRVSDSIHDHLGVEACAITIDLIGELVVYEKESHKIAGYSNAI
jgi:hypothetical protein